MSYLQQDNENLVNDIIKRKEFNWYKRWDNKRKDTTADIIPRFVLEKNLENSIYLKLSSFQSFVQNYINPNTPYKRILLKWSTGSGKTIGALSIAINFINFYKLEQESGFLNIGSIFIIGFSKKAFTDELLRYPEFGFISAHEHSRLSKLRKIASTGNKYDIENYKKFVIKIKKRFTNRYGFGFFKFYGYKEFVGKIFISNIDMNLSEMSESEIVKNINLGNIKYNDELLVQFKNSLIICDEIHNVYNSVEKNNWGIAVQAVLDKEPSCRAVLCSATPLNNSPTEIVDLSNLLNTVENRITKSYLFDENDKLKPGAHEKIKKLFCGKISFIQDINPKYYPSVSMIGETIKGIPYLKFIRCPMSKFHYDTYKKNFTGKLSLDSVYLLDFAMENPDDPSVGIYKTEDIKNKIQDAPSKWCNKYGITYGKNGITGTILQYNNLKKYSTKYVKMLDYLMDIIKNKKGKTFIYHNAVRISGVMFIEQILLANGFIDEFSGSNSNTICMHCGKKKSEHKLQNSEVIPTTGGDDGSADLSSESHNGSKLPKQRIDDGSADLSSESLSINSYSIFENNNKMYFRFKDRFLITANKKQLYPHKKSINKHKHTNLKGDTYDDKDKHFWLIKSGNIEVDVIQHQEQFKSFIDKLDATLIIEVPVFLKKLGNFLLEQHFEYLTTIKNYVILQHKNKTNKNLEKQKREYEKIKKDYEDKKTKELANNELHINQDKSNDSDLSELALARDGSKDLSSELALARDGSDGSELPKPRIVVSNDLSSELALAHNPDNLLPYNNIEIDKKEEEAEFNKLKKIKLNIFGSAEQSKSINHIFTPARYVMAHNEIERSVMDYSLEKFNSADNTYGEKYLILIGSRIIKESYNTNAIQNVFIMSSPVNISTFIQIRGRAVRKNSHKKLPLENRHVNIYIFTSCLPNKLEHKTSNDSDLSLSYEEVRYKRQIFKYQQIQQIEKILHENAIDSYINANVSQGMQSTSLSSLSSKSNNKTNERDHYQKGNSYDNTRDPLSALPYKPNIKINTTHELPLSELNLSTFNVYYENKEIDIVKLLIKRLFIEKSAIWEYDDLFQAIKTTNYETVINNNLISENNYLIALSQLLWNTNNKYTDIIIENDKDTEHNTDSTMDLIDKLYDNNNKIIKLPNGENYVIIELNSDNKLYFTLSPLEGNTPILDIDLYYRINKNVANNSINMNNFIKNKHIDFDYDDKKKVFYKKYIDINIENMQSVICEYGTKFHIKLLEECIEYIFNVWTNPSVEQSFYHEFYFKMLYYYDLMSLVIFAYTTKTKIFERYKKYAIPVKSKEIKLKILEKYDKRKENIKDFEIDDNSDLATSGIINLLRSSLGKSSNVWIPNDFREHYNNIVESSLTLFINKKKKNKNINKVSSELLPVGHYIGKFPKFYNPDIGGWQEESTYRQSDNIYIENNIIIGYDSRSDTGVYIRFKLRNPIHNIKKFKDIRMIERGVVGLSKSKEDLMKIADKLDIDVSNNSLSRELLCDLIRNKLIRLELKERIKQSKIKYFYFHWEEQAF